MTFSGTAAPLPSPEEKRVENRIRQKIEWRPRMRSWVGRIKYWDSEAEKWTRTPVTDLGTDDEGQAQERYDRWLETGVLPSAGSTETFASAALRVVEKFGESDKSRRERIQRLVDYALPKMGHVALGELEMHHVATALDAMAAKGMSAATVLKLRGDISKVLGYLERKGVIARNVALGCDISEDAEEDDRERIVLTDEEYLRFWKARGFETELDMMVLFSRCLAAHRTSDLHAADWAHFDRESWRVCQVRRPKTDGEPDARGRTAAGRRRRERKGASRATRAYKFVDHVIPDMVRGPLVAWWERAGRPSAGPVFPYRSGPKVGQRKAGRGISYAKAFRKAVWEAGIVRVMPGREADFEAAVGEKARKALCLLQTPTETTKPLDFHGHRAAAITALCQAGLSDLELTGVVGHSQPKTSTGYLRRRVVGMPEKALPGGGENKQGRPESGVSPKPPAPPMAAERARAREGARAAALDVLAGVLGGDRSALASEKEER